MRSKVKRGAQKIEILMGDIEEDVNPYSGRVMHKRIDVRKPEQMGEEATFETTDSERVPTAYFVPASEKGGGRAAARSRHRARARRRRPTTLPIEEFQIASTDVTPKPFENHQERTVTGK